MNNLIKISILTIILFSKSINASTIVPPTNEPGIFISKAENEEWVYFIQSLLINNDDLKTYLDKPVFIIFQNLATISKTSNDAIAILYGISIALIEKLNEKGLNTKMAKTIILTNRFKGIFLYNIIINFLKTLKEIDSLKS